MLSEGESERERETTEVDRMMLASFSKKLEDVGMCVSIHSIIKTKSEREPIHLAYQRIHIQYGSARTLARVENDNEGGIQV